MKNLRRTYCKYLFAAFGSAVVTSIYSIVDLACVGQYEGPVGAAAMSVITPMWSVIISIGMLFGIGGSVVLAIARGEGKESRANACFTCTLVVSLILTAVVTIVFVLRIEDILRIFGAEGETLVYAVRYARWIAVAVPFFMMGQVLLAFVRNDGAPVLAGMSIICGGVLNIIGDIYLVFVRDMGIEGAGLATAAGQAVAFLILCTHFLSRRNGLKLIFGRKNGCGLRQIPGLLKEALAAGLSPFLVDISFGVAVALFNNQIARYAGSDELAIFGAVANCAILLQCLFYAVGHAVQPIASLNYGAKQYENVRAVLKMAIVTAGVMGVLFFGIMTIFADGILRLFMDTTDRIMEIGPAYCREYSFAFLLMGINIAGSYFLQAILKTKEALFISLLRGFVFSGLLMFALPAAFGFSAIWWAMPLSELLTLAVTLPFLKKSMGRGPAVSAEQPV